MSGYIDLQVNGFAGVDFNQDRLSHDDFAGACQAMIDDGVEKFCPTIITDDLQTMIYRIQRISNLVECDSSLASLVAGIHVEGPFISAEPGFVGAHPKQFAGPAKIDAALSLVDAGKGLVKIFTLAPEMDPECRVTARLADEGILVAAGHSDASIDQLSRCIDSGLALYTHLGNGCPSMMHRHDNIITRVLSLSDRLSISLIADGHHVPWHAFSTYLKCIPNDRLIVVSDAISAAGLGPGIHSLAGQEVEVDSDGAAWAKGREHFAGCATPLSQMEKLLRQNLDVSTKTCQTWMRENPARLLGLTF